jgi:hypothetical protein
VIIVQDEGSPSVKLGLIPPNYERKKVNDENTVPAPKSAVQDNDLVERTPPGHNETETRTVNKSLVEELSTTREVPLNVDLTSSSTTGQNQTSPNGRQALSDKEPGLPTELERHARYNSAEHLATPPRRNGDDLDLVKIPNTELDTDAGFESAENLPLLTKGKMQALEPVEERQTSSRMSQLEASGVEMIAAQKILTESGSSHNTPNQDLQDNSRHDTTANRRVPRAKTLVGYDNLFRIYSGEEPKISTCIDVATDQIEFIFNLSTLYGLPVKRIVEIREFFEDKLSRFEHKLWKAIMEDPARWLYLSMFLRSPDIFKEAIIHIVGYHSHDPWTHPYEEFIPTNVSILIKDKVEELIIAKECADAALLRCTIMVDGIDVREIRRGIGYDAYNCWHDWYRDQMADALEARQNGDNIDGVRYQLIAWGGDKYLEPNATVEKYKATLARNRAELSSDEEKSFLLHLSTMKEQATTIALPMVNNNSRLDNFNNGINHLTCTDVVEGEFAWEMDAMDPYFGP